MAEKLTPAQQAAVNHRGGRLLVSAAAGSGKTKVLVDRLMVYLMGQEKANLDDFLMITYTKAAASELRSKIAKKLTEHIAENPDDRHLQQQLQRLYLAKISTVHGFCGDVLRQYAYRLSIPGDFRVADENECDELRAEVLSELLEYAYLDAEDTDFRAMADTQGYGRDDRRLPEIILRVFDSARCHLDPEKWLDDCLSHGDVSDVSDASETVWGRELMAQLYETVDQQLAFYRWASDSLRGMDKMQKVLDNLADTIAQLTTLRQCATWDAIHAFGEPTYGTLTFPKSMEDTLLRDQIKSLRDEGKKELKEALRVFTDDSTVLLEDLSQCAAAQRGLIDFVRQFGQAYAQKKKTARILDFSDLEHRMLDLLLGTGRTGPTAAAAEIGDRFREIMVDEYQDSNEVQDAIFDALTCRKGNLFMVGDVKQSIYQFRLADPTIFLKKYEDYGSDPEKGQRVLLSANFRSGGEVVEAVNDVFDHCMTKSLCGIDYTDGQALVEGIAHDPLPDAGVELHCIQAASDSYAQEAEFVAGRIAQMLREGTLIRGEKGFRPVQPEDIVILLRSPGSVGGDYRRALESRSIPYNTGSGENLLQTQEVATLRAILQIISNPRQDIPLISVLASPVFGFTADDLALLRSGCRRGGLYDALTASSDPKCLAFLEILNALRRYTRTGSLTGLVQNVLNETKLDSIFASLPGGSARAKNLQTFFALVSDYEAGALRTLEQFLDHLTAMEEKGISAETAPSGVTIMSIHKSKGLEFPVVFLCALSKRFNTMDQRADILCDKELGLGLSVVDTEKRLRYPSLARRAIAARMNRNMVSEEMRVLYVAMTRARDRLIMTFTHQYLTNRLTKLSTAIAFDGGKTAAMKADCCGNWVLLTALGRTESGQLRQVCGAVLPGRVSDIPWQITYRVSDDEASEEAEKAVQARPSAPAGIGEKLQNALAFSYPYEAATRTPSKQTATGRKDHFLDAEAAEFTRPALHLQHRRPNFLGAERDGRAYGTAMHLCMQHLDFSRCANAASIEEELNRLESCGFMKPEERAMVNASQIARFFETPIGQKLCAGSPCLREFKFSILDDASRYEPGLAGEQVLLQGVVDCALLDEDGITVLDFKTDRVTEETLSETVLRYTPQLRTYAESLERIYGKPVKESFLYFFRLNRFVKIER